MARSLGAVRRRAEGHALGEVIVNLDAPISAREAEDYPPLKAAGVTRHLIYMWRRLGKLHPVAHRDRSPLYRFGDILAVERDTRRSGASHRGPRAA